MHDNARSVSIKAPSPKIWIIEPKHDLRYASAPPGCACRTHFGCNLRCACVQCIFRLAKCDRNIARFFGNNERNDDWNVFSFGVTYDSVAQKWRILAMFGELLGRYYWDLKQRLKAKILNWVLLYNKVAVTRCELWPSKKASCAQLLRACGSCACGKSK